MGRKLLHMTTRTYEITFHRSGTTQTARIDLPVGPPATSTRATEMLELIKECGTTLGATVTVQEAATEGAQRGTQGTCVMHDPNIAFDPAAARRQLQQEKDIAAGCASIIPEGV